MKNKLRRPLAFLLSAAMIFTMWGSPVYAVADSGQPETGLCEHHPEHTAGCGYTEGTPGASCTHEHTEDCYVLVESCVHEHTGDCYPAPDGDSVSGNAATPSEAEEAEPAECTHECSEDTGCITKELDCRHEHDEECGYTEETPGTPCAYVCDICGAENSGEDGQKPETESGAQEQCSCIILCTEDNKNPDCPVCGAEGADLSVCKGKAPDSIEPECICTSICTEDTMNEDCPVCKAEGAKPENCKGKPAAKTENPAVAAVIALIDALPTVDEIYDGMVGDGEEGYDEWLAGMQTILADIQRAKVEYDALSVEDRALIDQTHTDKLQELVGLTDRLKEAAPMTDKEPTITSTEIFANGIPIKIVAGTTEGRTNILWDIDGDGSIGDDEYLKIGSDAPSAAGYDLSDYNIYGGGNGGGTVTGSTSVIIAGGTMRDVYGGGRNSIVTSTNISVTGGTVRDVFGGGSLNDTVTSTNVTISGGTVRDVYGGGGSGTVTSTNVTISGSAQVTGNVYGGGYAGTVTGSTNVNVSGGAIKNVYGGGITNSTVTDSTSVTISGNIQVTDNVYDNGNGGTVEGSTSINVSDGATVTVDGSLISSGTLIVDGTLTGTGTLLIDSSDARVISGKGTIDDALGILVFLTDDMIADIEPVVYTGSAFTPEPEVSIQVLNRTITYQKGDDADDDADFYYSYSDNTNAGTATVTVVPNFSTLIGDPLAKKFTIQKSGSALGLTADKLDKTYTYGDSITFTVMPKVQQSVYRSRTAAENTVDFYCGETKLNDTPITAVEGKAVTFVYDTGKKGIPTGTHTITAVYGGSGNLNGVTESVEVTINPKTLTAAVNSADSKATKVYDKNNRFTDVTLTLNGLVNADDAVTAVADGTATDANVGSGKAFTVTSVTLSGVDQDYYTLAIGDVSGTVTIIAGESRLALTADKTTATYGDTITFTVTPALKTTLQSRTAAENTVDFYCGETKLNDTPITAVEGKAAAFTYDTNQKGIPAGTQSIKAVYSGGGNLNGVTESVEVTINPKALTAAVKSGDASAAKVYDGSADFSGVKLTLDGVIGSDAVSATASGTADNANAGDGKAFNVTAVALNGADNGWYSLAESAVSGTVKITKASGGLNISCSDVTYGGTVSPTVTANLGGGAVAYSYKGRNGTSYGPSDTAPTDAGQYTVVATAEATENYESATATADFEIKKAAGRLTISCADVTYGGTVSPTVTANLGGGAVTYSYAGRNGTSYGPSDTAPTDAGQYTVTGTAAATTNYEQATSAAVDFTINKAAGAAISSVTGSYTGDGSTFTYIIDPTTGAEYSTDNTNWQDGNTFTGFKVGDTATFYARMKADQNHTAGPSGNTGAVTFTRLAQTENPSLQYTVSGATGSKKITIAKVAGCEYTFDNGASWGGENEQTFATDGRPVIGIRYAQTATHEASAGAMQEVDLKNQEQAAPKAFTLKFMDNGDGTFTAAIPTVTGGEYSFDGVNWSDSNTKTDCLPNTAYTGYVRLAAKDGYNASPVTSDTRTAPSLIVADPVIKPNGGDFSGSLNVTITTDTPGAAIYYTIDGTAPTVASTAYTDPFTLTASATVQAIAVKDGYEDSQITSAVFTKRTGGSSGGGGGSSSGNSGGTSQPDTGKPDKPDAPVTGETKPVQPDKNGSVSVDNGSVQSAIDKAKQEAQKNGTTENGIAVTVPVTLAANQTSFHVTIQAETLDLLVKEKVRQFTVATDHLVSVNLGMDTLKQLDTVSAGGDIILRADKVDALGSTEAKAAIGTRPAYDLSLVYLSGGKETPINNLNGHTVSVRLPYAPAKGEAAGNLYAVYVDDAGKVEWITKSSYDASLKAVVFETGHFSVYGIGYKNPVPAFTDITGHWAADNILFVASRGLLSGTSDTTFSPDTGMTRGMFVTALGRLAGINPDSYKTGKFTDVKADAYYAPYVNWAAQTGIVEGVTSTTFAPDTNINREQMAVIMANYAKQLGYDLPKTLQAVTFADNANISSWAKEAVRAMQQAGILAGKANNRFDPKGTATRAEVATLLRRFVEIVIDPQAANGWQQNDSGQWSYYRNGEPVKGWLSDDQKWYWLDKTTGMMFAGGWKQIDGKWYYFYPDGAMAVNTTIDGYTIGSDGARK